MVGNSSKIEGGGQQHHHRSSLKQKNKPFKGASRSKSKGREATKGPSGVTKRAVSGGKMSKKDRKNQAKLIQLHKREVLQRERKAYKGRDGMPRVVCVIPVSEHAEDTMQLPWKEAWKGEGMVYCEGSRQMLSLHLCSRRRAIDKADWLGRLVQMVQVADCVLLVGASGDGVDRIDQAGLEAFSILRAIGVSSLCAFVTNCLQKSEKESWLRLLQAECSSIHRLFSHDPNSSTAAHQQEMERHICEQHLNGISWRDERAYMIADNIEYSPGNSHFKVTGFVRGGRPFSANRLIHIPQLASNFIIDRISCAGVGGGMIEQERREELAEQLTAEGQGDLDSKEAMFAAAESMIAAADDEANDIDMSDAPKSKSKLVPKGTSAYQAAWLSDEEQVADEEEEFEEVLMEPEDEEDESGDVFDKDKMEEDHERELAKHHLEFNERHFPDEIELDPHISAKNRLQKYRGCASLRTGKWDRNEGLPVEYGKIYQFADYRQSRKAALEDPIETAKQDFTVGMKVTLWIRLDNREAESKLASLLQQQPEQQKPLFMTVFGLLRYEQQMTIVNFVFSPPKSLPPQYHLRNKQQLLAIMGFRRLLINPLLSHHTPNANLHRMVREVGGEEGEEWPATLVGTVYAPVIHPPTPILLFDHDMILIGVGSVIDLNPHRIILKRITLTGVPFKSHKRTAVVRFMFSNPADVNWFRPVELCTRLGARGHIRESLGTHGYMKCIFDRTVFQHDTVAMHLYKRVFPKYTTISF